MEGVRRPHHEIKLRYLGKITNRGFETRFAVGAAVVQVGAVMEDGAEYRSKVVSVF